MSATRIVVLLSSPPVFEPPVIDVSPIDGIAHINLDLALEYLIGDQLR